MSPDVESGPVGILPTTPGCVLSGSQSLDRRHPKPCPSGRARGREHTTLGVGDAHGGDLVGSGPALRAPPWMVKDGEVGGPRELMGQGRGEAPSCPAWGLTEWQGRVGTGLGQCMNVRGQCLEGSHSLQTGPCSLEFKTSGLDWAETGPSHGQDLLLQLSGTERRRQWAQPSVLLVGNPEPQSNRPIA